MKTTCSTATTTTTTTTTAAAAAAAAAICYARYIIKGQKDIKKNHDYTYTIFILRQEVFDAHGKKGWWR